MALPKKRHSRSRRDKRRTHDRLKEQSLSLCSQCSEPKLPHRACLSCGTYRGREVIVTKEK
jgi:large subunit ribosomal protein L32